METNPDSATLAQQVQALAAIIEELTKQKSGNEAMTSTGPIGSTGGEPVQR